MIIAKIITLIIILTMHRCYHLEETLNNLYNGCYDNIPVKITLEQYYDDNVVHDIEGLPFIAKRENKYFVNTKEIEWKKFKAGSYLCEASIGTWPHDETEEETIFSCRYSEFFSEAFDLENIRVSIDLGDGERYQTLNYRCIFKFEIDDYESEDGMKRIDLTLRIVDDPGRSNNSNSITIPERREDGSFVLSGGRMTKGVR